LIYGVQGHHVLLRLVLYLTYTGYMNIPPPFQLDLSDPLSQWRAETFWTKEVETLEWLKFFSTFQENSIETLVDVGANIGVYSLYWLSLRSTAKCISCEPFADNSHLLKLNLQLNGYGDRVKIIEQPIYSELSEGQLRILDIRPGSSGAQFDSTPESLTLESKKLKAVTLDSLILDCPVAYILKIDVDGLDFDILKGSVRSLKSGCVKSILIESSEEVQLQINDFLQGFSFVPDDRFNNLSGHSDIRRKEKNSYERNRVYSLTSAF